jgi:hypothetical protein
MSTTAYGLVGPAITLAGKGLDLVLKDQPTMQVWPERFLDGPNVYMYLAVTNTAKHKVEILGVTATTGLFQIWKDSSAESAGDAWAGIVPAFILEPEETKYLPILAADRRPENHELPSWVVLRWRSLQHPSWWRLPVKLKLSHAEFDRIQRAA